MHKKVQQKIGETPVTESERMIDQRNPKGSIPERVVRGLRRNIYLVFAMLSLGTLSTMHVNALNLLDRSIKEYLNSVGKLEEMNYKYDELATRYLDLHELNGVLENENSETIRVANSNIRRLRELMIGIIEQGYQAQETTVNSIDPRKYEGPFEKLLELAMGHNEPTFISLRLMRDPILDDSPIIGCRAELVSLGLLARYPDLDLLSSCTGFIIEHEGSVYSVTAGHCEKGTYKGFMDKSLSDNARDYVVSRLSNHGSLPTFTPDFSADIGGIDVETLVYDHERTQFFVVSGRPFRFRGMYGLIADFATPDNVRKVELSGSSGGVVVDAKTHKAVGVITSTLSLDPRRIVLFFSSFQEGLGEKISELPSEYAMSDRSLGSTTNGDSLATTYPWCAQLTTELILDGPNFDLPDDATPAETKKWISSNRWAKLLSSYLTRPF